jgi:hypothetical protein
MPAWRSSSEAGAGDEADRQRIRFAQDRVHVVRQAAVDGRLDLAVEAQLHAFRMRLARPWSR